MNREEKLQEHALEVMTQRVNEMKATLSSLIIKLEHDHKNITSPDFLDTFAVVSGQMNSLIRLLRSDKIPNLKALTVLPLLLNPDKDPNLVQITEGRIEAFNHEIVPDYLRTKPDPEVENKHSAIELRSSQMNSDMALKQPANLTKLANHLLEIIHNREAQEGAAANLPITSNPQETVELLSSLYHGKAFKQAPMPRQPPPQAQNIQAPSQMHPKAPQIKTTIKGASSHPYNR